MLLLVEVIILEEFDSELFNSRLNASHDDILFAPPKTPEINVVSVKMIKMETPMF